MRSPTSAENASVHSRLAFVANEFFGGVRETARALGVSPTNISEVTSGKRGPGGRLLTALAKQTSINLRWLLAGEGLPEAAADDWSRRAVPVYGAIPPAGLPTHVPHIVAQMELVEPAVFRPTLYWLRASSYMPIIQARDEKVRAGDLILIDTDRERFRRVDQLVGRVVAICVENVIGTLARVRRPTAADPEQSGSLILDAFSEQFSLEMPAAVARKKHQTPRSPRKLTPGSLPRQPERRSVTRSRRQAGPISGSRLTQRDIVGVGIMLRRGLAG